MESLLVLVDLIADSFVAGKSFALISSEEGRELEDHLAIGRSDVSKVVFDGSCVTAIESKGMSMEELMPLDVPLASQSASSECSNDA